MAEFIVNPGGAVHSVSEADLADVLARQPSTDEQRAAGACYRLATEGEIAGWYEAQGLTAPAKDDAGKGK